jgi:hypothetical protein
MLKCQKVEVLDVLLCYQFHTNTIPNGIVYGGGGDIIINIYLKMTR